MRKKLIADKPTVPADQRSYENRILASFAPYRLKDYGISAPVIPPHTVDLMVGISRCNNKCFGCPGQKVSPREDRPLDLEGWNKVLDNILSFIVGDHYVREIHFSHNWSDPLMSPYFQDIIAKIRDNSIYRSIHVITNGLLAGKRVASLAQTDVVNFSMNASNAENYKFYHGVNAYETVLKNAAELRKLADLINPGLVMRSSLVLREGVLGSFRDHIKRLQDAGFAGVAIRQDFYEQDPVKKEQLARKAFEFAQDNPPIPIIMKGFSETTLSRSPLCGAMRYWATVDYQGKLLHCIHNTDNDYGNIENLKDTSLQDIWQHMFRYGVTNNGAFQCTSTSCPSTIGMLNSLDNEDLHQYYPGMKFEDLKILDEFPRAMLLGNHLPRIELGASFSARDQRYWRLFTGYNLTDKNGKDLGVLVVSGSERSIFDNEGKLLAVGNQAADTTDEIVYRKYTKSGDGDILFRECSSNTEKGKRIFTDTLGAEFGKVGEPLLVEYDERKGRVTSKRAYKPVADEERMQTVQNMRDLVPDDTTRAKLQDLVSTLKTFQKKYPRSIVIDPFPMVTNPEIPLRLSEWRAFSEDEIALRSIDGHPIRPNLSALQSADLNEADYERTLKNLCLQFKALHSIGLIDKDVSIGDVIEFFQQTIAYLQTRFDKDIWSYKYITEKLQEPIFLDTAFKLFLQRGVSMAEQLAVTINPELYKSFKESLQEYDYITLKLTLPSLSIQDKRAAELTRKFWHGEITDDDIIQGWELMGIYRPETPQPDYLFR